jgi:sirohydrochlorin ferrochelatase
LNQTIMQTGIIIVDHGSRREQSNLMLEELAVQFAQRFAEKYSIVEPAHMELAEPSIATAYAKCVKRGATRVIVCPFFLGPGKHWTQDIPQLTASAAAKFPQTQFHVAQTLGIDDLILDLLDKRATFCVDHNLLCAKCEGTLRAGKSGVSTSTDK